MGIILLPTGTDSSFNVLMCHWHTLPGPDTVGYRDVYEQMAVQTEVKWFHPAEKIVLTSAPLPPLLPQMVGASAAAGHNNRVMLRTKLTKVLW